MWGSICHWQTPDTVSPRSRRKRRWALHPEAGRLERGPIHAGGVVRSAPVDRGEGVIATLDAVNAVNRRLGADVRAAGTDGLEAGKAGAGRVAIRYGTEGIVLPRNKQGLVSEHNLLHWKCFGKTKGVRHSLGTR
eukprot:3933523-Rhodomonas_salina.1